MKTRRIPQSLVKTVRFLSLFASLTAVLMVLLVLLVYGFLAGDRELHGGAWAWLLGLGAATLLIRLAYVLFVDPEELQDAAAEARFFLEHAHSAWAVAGGVASLVMGLFLLFPVGRDQLYERYMGGFGIYTGALGLSLGLHAFYRRTAPFTDLLHLLSNLTHDLTHSKPSRVWVVFPALNLGFYRSAMAGSMQTYNDYDKALRTVAEELKGQVRLVTYPEKDIAELYRIYHSTTAENGADPTLGEKASTAAQKLADLLKGPAVERWARAHTSPPTAFPHPVILVGDIVYVLLTYDLPAWDVGKATFVPPSNGKRKPAVIFAYRRHDPALADAIHEHLLRLFPDENQPTAATEGTSQKAASPAAQLQAAQAGTGAEGCPSPPAVVTP